jgi:antimicrobial peptide system SdpA family protein
MGASTDRRVRTLGWYALLMAFFWSVVVVYALHAAMPFNPIKLPLEDRLNIRVLLPEGFGFFTRNPRESRLSFYRRSDRGWETASVGPSQKVTYAFGWVRAVRAQNIEAGLLLQELPRPSRWKRCQQDPITCLSSAPTSEAIANPSPAPTLCGEIAFVEQESLPWAWASRGAKVNMPSRVIRTTIRCEAR